MSENVNGTVLEWSQTPGPWDLMSPGTAAKAHLHPSRYWNCYVTSEVGVVAIACGATKEEAEANARLIAAVPDLLDALKRAPCECPSKTGVVTEMFVRDGQVHYEKPPEPCPRCAAIAKAEEHS